MLYRHVPKNGDRLSILGFGAMRLALKDWKIDEPRAKLQIRHAIDMGVNYVDTAWPYHGGESESFLGRALADGYREKVKLATKLPSWMIKTEKDMDLYLNAQLKKLNTDRIDYYLLHALNGQNWDALNALNVMDFLNRAKADGRIVNTGFSFHGTLDDFKRIVDAYPWVVSQIQYNYLDEYNQAGKEGMRYAAARDIGIIIMEPLRGGNLGRPNPPPEVAGIWKEAKHQRTPVEWALRWVWNHPEVTMVLSGMNEEAHIDENLAIANDAYPDSLDEYELGLIERVARAYVQIMKVNCTGCGYCQPCPAGVSIPTCFEIYNDLHIFRKKNEAPLMYVLRAGGLTLGGPGYASQCVECGECLEKCPQGIDIPESLKLVVQDLEKGDMKQLEAMARNMFLISVDEC
jgi:uncharacterized protein